MLEMARENSLWFSEIEMWMELNEINSCNHWNPIFAPTTPSQTPFFPELGYWNNQHRSASQLFYFYVPQQRSMPSIN